MSSNLHTPCPDRVADGIGIRNGIDQGIGAGKLLQPVDVAVADEWLAMRRRPLPRAPIEIDLGGVEPVDLYRVEQIGMPIELPPQARGRRKERMRRDHQTAGASLEPPHIVK